MLQVSKGRDHLTLDQWLGELNRLVLLSSLSVRGHAVRLTVPQATHAFHASAAAPAKGLQPAEFAPCVARAACEKYKAVVGMGPGLKVRALLGNLLHGKDEEDALAAVIK